MRLENSGIARIGLGNVSRTARHGNSLPCAMCVKEALSRITIFVVVSSPTLSTCLQGKLPSPYRLDPCTHEGHGWPDSIIRTEERIACASIME